MQQRAARSDDPRHWLLVATHHIILDYWSMDLVVEELSIWLLWAEPSNWRLRVFKLGPSEIDETFSNRLYYQVVYENLSAANLASILGK